MMSRSEAVEEYGKALKEGQKEYKECVQKGLPANPAVLDEILETDTAESCVSVGLTEIPIHRIIGTKTAGRVAAFSASFRPLMKTDTEFATKWINLCEDHLGEEGIHDPIECYEYLGDFYVQEGNKRVSVLRHFGASRIAANVKRILPVQTDTPRMKAYNEFLEFYKRSGLYDVRFTTPGGYAKLLAAMELAGDHVWTEEERRRFRAYFHYFKEALDSAGSGSEKPQPEDALLMWLEVHPFADLGDLSTSELKKTVNQLWPNLLAVSTPEPVVKTEPPVDKNVLVQFLKGVDYLNVAFIHKNNAQTSHWTQAHEGGRKYMEEALGDAVTTKVYFDANTPEQAEKLIDQAVEEGADVVFTTAPQLIAPCMKGSVKYPKVRFLNCSVHQPYASVRTYYSRIYEGKFISGAIAGAMSKSDDIGYIASYPIFGVPAGINAFALGAQLTNPHAKIHLRWSCVGGDPLAELKELGVDVISTLDIPMPGWNDGQWGTFRMKEDGSTELIASPYWNWGTFYVQFARNILSGGWDSHLFGKHERRPVNYWWGMPSGVIDVEWTDAIPEGTKALAEMLKNGIINGTVDPFCRPVFSQDGQMRNDGSASLSPEEKLNMDWLCSNVEGTIPEFEELSEKARKLVRLLGIYRDSIPLQKECVLL